MYGFSRCFLNDTFKATQRESAGDTGTITGVGKNSWRRKWQPTPIFLPGKSHGWRSLVGGSPWGRTELDTTERLHFHFSLSCIGERNGNLLQCSCLENPRDGEAWWAAVYGVAQCNGGAEASKAPVRSHTLLQPAPPRGSKASFSLQEARLPCVL